METFQEKIYLLCVCILLTQAIETQATELTIAPCKALFQNIAVYEGTLNTFIHFPAAPKGLKWSTYATTDEIGEATIIDNDDIVSPSHVKDFSISPIGLTILNATTTAEKGHQLSTAGLYTVECGGNAVKFKFLVVRHDPTCSKKLSLDETSVEITCSSIYGDSTFDPMNAIFTLYVDGKLKETNTPQRTNHDASTYISTSTFTTAYNKSSVYQCLLTFGQPTQNQDPRVVTNAPAFNHTCSVN